MKKYHKLLRFVELKYEEIDIWNHETVPALDGGRGPVLTVLQYRAATPVPEQQITDVCL